MGCFTPSGLRSRARAFLILASAFFIYTCVAPAAPAASNSPTPVAIAQLQSFRGRLVYSAQPSDEPGHAISGALTVNGVGWLLEERSATSLLHISSEQSWLRANDQTMYFDDPFPVRGLANPWALLLGKAAGEAVAAEGSGSSWTIGPRLRVYVDEARGRVAGLVDTAQDADVSFAFDDWIDVAGLSLPRSIVRMRGGTPDASFTIRDYQVQWGRPSDAAAQWRSIPPEVAPTSTLAAQAQPASGANVWRPFGMLFGLLFLGLLAAAWLRRDALVDHLCRRLAAADARAWRSEGASVFVTPEGVLWFDGRPYLVGAMFYNRRATVQSSPLFLRVSAAGVSRAIVLARKFRLPRRSLPPARRHAAGFTLVEALVATALFASVIVAAVFPTLIVLARADRVAAEHETAVQIAANALVDEESALAYGSSIDDTSASSSVEGMRLTVIVSPGSVLGLHTITAQVDAPSGAVLARIATMVGPPVPAPAASAAPPQSR